MIIISSRSFAERLNITGPVQWFDSARIKSEWLDIRAKLEAGESMIVIGTENFEVFKDIQITGIRHRLAGISAFAPLPVPGLGDIEISPGAALCPYFAPAYVTTPGRHTLRNFGTDEAIRADILPLIENRDSYGKSVAFPAAVVRNKDSAMVSGNFKGSFWYFFGYDEPLEAISADGWRRVLDSIAAYDGKRCFIARFSSEYPAYYAGERIRLGGRVENLSGLVKRLRVKIDLIGADGSTAEAIDVIHCGISGRDTLNVSTDYYPELEPGVNRLRATLYEQDRFLYNAENEDVMEYLDSLEFGIVISDGEAKSPVASAAGTKIFIDGRADYFIGTHLYPTNNFYDLNFDALQVLACRKTAEHMREAGVRLCRVWLAPLIDENQLRGIEAMLKIFAENGIVMILTVHTSWVKYMYINIKGCHERVQISDSDDFSFLGIYAKNMEGQKRIVEILAGRYAGYANLIWDFSNEFNIVNPRDEHVDEAWFGSDYKKLDPPYDGMEIFRKWGGFLGESVRKFNKSQLILYGNAVMDSGCESYRCAKGSDFISDHQYYDLYTMGRRTQLINAACINKPMMLEEFGMLTDSVDETAAQLEHRLYYALAAGHSAALTYEWGYMWRVEQLPPFFSHWRGANHKKPGEVSNHVALETYNYADSWIKGSFGIMPGDTNANFSINAHGTTNPMPYIEATRRMKEIGRGLGYAPKEKNVYVVIPLEYFPYKFGEGYVRRVGVLLKTFDALYRNGIDFGLWQSDCIDSLPETAGHVIYPNECEIPDDIGAQLKALGARGAVVYKGGDMSFAEAAPKLDAESELPLEYLFRDTDEGRLLVTMNYKSCAELSKSLSDLTHFARYSADPLGKLGKRGRCRVGDIEFIGSDHNLLLTEEDSLRLAQVYGELKRGGIKISDSDGGKRYYIKSMDGLSLEKSRDMLVGVYEPGEVTICGVFESAALVDDGRYVADFILCRKDGDTVLKFTEDEKMYAARVKR